MDNSSFVSFILKFSAVTKGHGVRDYHPSPPFFTESGTPQNFFRKQKEYTNEFISRVISVQCDKSTCKKHACNAAIPVTCTVKSKKKMPGCQFTAYKLHVPRQIEILFSTLMTLFCEK